MSYETVLTVLTVLTILFILLALNFYRALNRTLFERLRIIDRACNNADDMASINSYRSVSYSKHMWYVFSFRDAHQLYISTLRPPS